MYLIVDIWTERIIVYSKVSSGMEDYKPKRNGKAINRMLDVKLEWPQQFLYIFDLES